MTLLFTDGFDLYGSTGAGDVSQLAPRWSAAALGAASSFRFNASAFTTGRFGTGHSTFHNPGGGGAGYPIMRAPVPARGTLTVGFAVIHTITGSGAPGQGLFSFYDGGSQQLELRVDQTGIMRVYRNGGGGTLLGTSLAGACSTNIWHFVEFQATFATGTGGSFIVKVDTFTVLNVSAVNTSQSGAAQATVLALEPSGTLQTTATCQADDFYCLDANGAVNNTFLGDVNIVGLLPNTNGSHSNFTRVGGSASGNFTAVNENTIDNDTSYVTAQSVGTIDTYAFPALSSNVSSIFAVNCLPTARKDDAGNRTLTTRVRAPDAVEADAASAAMTLTASYAIGQQIEEISPRTGIAWTKADISSGEFGPKIVT